MADKVISIGPRGETKKKLHDNGDGSFSDSVYVVPAAAESALTPVSAASVAAGQWSALDGQMTNGHQWARVLVVCNKVHTIRYVGGLADFTDYTVGSAIGSDSSGNLDNSAKGGVWQTAVDVSGLSHFCPTVQNNHASDAATVTVKVVFFD
jgi:hypothetical protein